MKALCLVLGVVVMVACTPQSGVETKGENPLLSDRQTPFDAPPFDDIEESDILPAFEAAIVAHDEEISAITSRTEPATFANTIEALDRSGQMLDQVHLYFLNLNMANSTPGLQEMAKVINPAWTGHQDDIMLNAALFERVAAVWDMRDDLGLDVEQQRLLDRIYRGFVRGGARLEASAQDRLREINGEISMLSTQFGENLLKEMNAIALLIEDEEDLVGLPEGVRDAAAALAEAQGHEAAWAFNLQRTSWTPFLQYSERRDLRQQLYTAYLNLCHTGGATDNAGIAARIAALRVERAEILGFESHAAYVLDEQMAETPSRVNDLLSQLWTPALAKAKAERDELQNFADSAGDDITIALWDWWLYSEKLRAEKYDFDEGELKPYLALDAVRQAAFDVAGRLWGLRFTERNDVPVYHPDVQAYEVSDDDGRHIGLLYTDYYAREGKRGGAWMEFFRRQYTIGDTDVRPIVVNVGNFSKPPQGQPALLSIDEVGTVFHEFGHALHGLLSDVRYATLSGTNVARDFVELPSQIMENWAFAPEVMAGYARHVETGEAIPSELIERVQKANTFNQGFQTTEYLAASLLDMAWHSRTDTAIADVDEFEDKLFENLGLIPEIAPRYRTTYFGHIFSGEYSAGYYSYVWAEVLDADAFKAFREKGLFDQELAQSYRENILAAGDSEAPMVLYERFLGREPDISALLERRGLN